ncbi:MAG: DEAD/DEAH box helicase family protein [Herpetosiphonaceae bacterium]|nr:DEAD/DEAH box helicase family protein [Herpetosiphonaceae bacterium]
MDTVFVVLDVESTGLETGVDELIEVAAVKFQGDRVLETFQQLVKPRHSLPIKIAQLTGINQSDLEAATPFHEVAPAFVRFLRSYPVIGHSIHFDLRMLAAQGLQLSQRSYDTFELATLLLPGQPSYSLTALAAALEIPHPDAHRALADSEVTRQLFLRLMARIEQLDDTMLGEIIKFGGQMDWGPRPLFEQVLRERAMVALTKPLSSTPAVEPGVPWRQFVPLEPARQPVPLDPTLAKGFFATDGLIGRAFPGYEARPPQVHMTEAVVDAFNAADTLMVEAGTGTGKSLAYLVPAAEFAASRGQRVVVSTNTINLQDQLYGKDIPALQQVIDHATVHSGGVAATQFEAALLKGRGNYLCLRRYGQLRQTLTPTPEQARALIKLGLWVGTTQTGDRAEIALQDEENRVWGDVNVTLDTCTGPRCPAFDRCFFFAARRAAEAAHVIVVNHALLLSDLKADGKVLPPYDHVVIDEAHHLEDVATDQLGWATDQGTLLHFLDGIWLAGGARIVSGLLSELPNHFKGSGATAADVDRAEGFAAPLRLEVDRARVAVHELWNRLRLFMERQCKEGSYELRLRLTPALRKGADWITMQGAWEQLMLPLADLGRGLAKLEEHIRGLEDAELLEYDALVLQLSGLANMAVDTAIAGSALFYGDDEQIQWLWWDRQRDVLRLHAAPLHVGPLLQEKLFAGKETVVLASATMSINGSFQYIKERLGLADAPISELQLPSPFDYQRSTLLYLPTDMPEPQERGYQAALENALIELAKATGGRMLALFTSNSALRQTYRAISEPLEEHDIVVLGQGLDGSRRSVLQRFREHPHSVLLGTSSFWEGVDVVGDALSVLVVCKLPFAVPNDPIFAARSELFNDPFNEYAVPQAILKFKQGFGRLIRSKEDRGVVAVLDRRLLSKRYGELFLRSLPPATTQRGPLQQLPLLAARWLV